MNIQIPKHVYSLFMKLEKAGFKTYFVGGAVRDSLLSKPIHDWDLTTTALPQETAEIFKHYQLLLQGASYGTVTVITEGKSVEITTMREESNYQNFRTPTVVIFTKQIEMDLKRRDFTINAMAYHPTDGLIDPFQGYSDLKKRQIKTVGKPYLRFQEDALRILRCLRFSAVLGYSIESETALQIKIQALNLNFVSRERIRDEFLKLICGNFAVDIIKNYTEVFSVFLPLQLNLSENNFYEFKRIFSSSPADFRLRIAMLASENNLTINDRLEKVKLCCENLRLTKKDSRLIFFLIQYKETELSLNPIKIKKQIIQMGEDNFFLWLSFKEGYYFHSLEMIHKIKEKAKVIIKHECLSLRNLNIRGNDLLRIGFSENKQLGKVLSYLLTQVIEENIKNDFAALQKAAADWLTINPK